MHTARQHLEQPRHDAQRNLWLPPGRLLRYQLIKVGAAAIALAIFTLWQTLRWHNPAMRVLTIALQVITVWVVARSVVSDILRARGRQLELTDGVLLGARPGGSFAVALADVAQAQWRDDTDAALGLWLLDAQGHTLVQLDANFIADESEARDFLRWARQRSTLEFPVRWPIPS